MKQVFPKFNFSTSIKTLLSFLLLFFYCFTLIAQNEKKLNIVINDQIATPQWIAKFQKKTSFTNQPEKEDEIRKLFFLMREKGYITASADSFHQDSVQNCIFITLGNCYKWANLKKGNADEDALNAVGYREKFYFKHIFSPREVARLLEEVVVYEENNGYPFASIKLDSITFDSSQISASLNLQKNQLCLIDSFLVKGKAKISSYYLERLIGIRKGDKYNESRILQIGNRIREAPFLSQTRVADVYFSEKYSKLILYLEEKKANRFDGILGFLPNESTGKVLITGQLTLKLINSFNKGEQLDVDWQKLQAKTQNLKTRLQIPFLFRSPFGADLGFKLYKRDTLFTDVSQTIGLNYLVGANKYFKVFFINRNIALISTRGLENLTSLPQWVDMNSKAYGLGFRAQKLDSRINPRKGYSIEINGSAGTKWIKKNLKIKQEAYEGVELKTNIYTLDFNGELFVPFQKRSTFVLGNKAAWIENKKLFTNELFRIGGLSTLRGFDEESINASAYTITKLEYRFLLDPNSYLFMFANHAYYQNKTARDTSNVPIILSDNPYGFGVGITFETKPGIFSLSYALGKQFNNPISLRSAKIHFGIVSTF